MLLCIHFVLSVLNRFLDLSFIHNLSVFLSDISDSVGYSPFFRGIKSQMTVLSMLVEQPRKSVSSESASSVVDVPCVENGNMSPSVQSIHTDTVAFHSNIDQSRRDRFIDCLVS